MTIVVQPPVFGNGTEWDYWSYKWCRTCKNDINRDCLIILNMLCGMVDENIVRLDDAPNDTVCLSYAAKDDR